MRQVEAFEARGLLAVQFEEHAAVCERTLQVVSSGFVTLTDLCVRSLEAKGKLLFFGNGGSAADAQHIATELTVRYRDDRPAIAALALTTDSSAITAIGNDFGFEHLFSRQVEALARPGDTVIGISTSGSSPNVIKALEKAKTMGCNAAAFAGRDGGRLRGIAEPLLIVPSNVTARIQEMHILIGHSLCDAIERALGFV